jgi:predicted O-methyltransferase YrrM
MDTQAFLDALDDAFAGDPAEGTPADPRFAALASEVSGFTTPAELAVLNLAARLLPEGEAYLEVGTFKGRSVSAVLLDAPDRRVVAVENFMEFGMLGADARAELMRNLDRHSKDRMNFHLLDGDCFRLLADKHAVGEPVGVYFYDGAHTGLAHYLALGVVEPLLADEALVLVDDASWPMVAQATRRYLQNSSGWSVLRTFEALKDDDERWANGLMLLRFRRDARTAVGIPMGVEIRRRFQVYVRGPVTGLVWRTLHRFPRLVPLAKRVVPKRSRSVDSSG